MKSLVESAYSGGKESIGQTKDQIGKKIDDTKQTLEDKIVDSPLTSIGIAAVVGIILGLFFSRK